MVEFTVHDDAKTARAAAAAFFWRRVGPRLPWFAAGAVVLGVMTIAAAYYSIYHAPLDWVLRGMYSATLVTNALLLLMTLVYVPLFRGLYSAIAARQVRHDPVRKVRITDAEISIVSSKVSPQFHGDVFAM